MVRKSKYFNFNSLTPKPVSLTTVLSYFPSHRTVEPLGGRGPQVACSRHRPRSRPDSNICFQTFQRNFKPSGRGQILKMSLELPLATRWAREIPSLAQELCEIAHDTVSERRRQKNTQSPTVGDWEYNSIQPHFVNIMQPWKSKRFISKYWPEEISKP